MTPGGNLRNEVREDLSEKQYEICYKKDKNELSV